MDAIAEWIHHLIGSDHFRAYVIALIIILATLVVSRICTVALRKFLKRDNSPLAQASIVVNILRICIWVFGLSFMLSSCFNVNISALVAALGVGGIALSLGLQQTLQNFFGGLQITLLKIIMPGERITVDTSTGVVKDINWRQTVLQDDEGNTHIIPNAVLSSTEIIKINPSNINPEARNSKNKQSK